MTVTLHMLASDRGGRQTAFFSDYRPQLRFDHEQQVTLCTAKAPDPPGQFTPGQTHDIEFTCSDDVTVREDAPGFTLLERGREFGDGTVLFP